MMDMGWIAQTLWTARRYPSDWSQREAEVKSSCYRVKSDCREAGTDGRAAKPDTDPILRGRYNRQYCLCPSGNLRRMAAAFSWALRAF
jgi:hypothetical protein